MDNMHIDVKVRFLLTKVFKINPAVETSLPFTTLRVVLTPSSNQVTK